MSRQTPSETHLSRDDAGTVIRVGERTWPLDPSRVLAIGRDARSDIGIDDPQVSRRHAEVYRDPAAGWVLRDVGSANGVFVDGVRVRNCALAPGVSIRLGPSPEAPEVRIVWETETADPAEDGFATVVAPRTDSVPVTIGRAQDNTVVVDDFLASRHHARATRRDDGFWVEDLGSLNGTYIDGRPVRAQVLRPGQLLTIGRLEFHVDGGELVMVPQRLEVSLVASNLKVVLPGGKELLGGVSFALPSCSLLAVIGPSGAGKSTLLNALTGNRKATSGQVMFDGRDLYDHFRELRHRIGLVPQDDVVHPQLTVREALAYASRLRFPADLEKSRRDARIAQVVTELGLDAHLDTRIDRLSGGQRKRTSVALELLTEPSLLFLDEPTSGLDPGLDKSVMRTLRGLADGGRTVVVVTHSVANLGLCDRVLLLAPGGKVAYFGPPETVLAYFGEDDYADVFTDVAARPDEVAEAFRRHDPLLASDTGLGADRGDRLPEPPVRQQPVWSQLATLARRHVRVLLADRSYAAFMLLLPAVLALLVATVPGGAGFGPPPAARTTETLTLLVILVVGSAFMGMASSARDLVAERAIFRREKAVGLSTGAYLGAKLLVFALLALVQSGVLVGLVLTFAEPPDAPLVLGSGGLELYLAVAATTFCSAVLGLLVSSFVSTSEQVMPLIVVAIMAQLVLCGGVIPVGDRAVLEQVAWVTPSRWGFAAGAATTDVLNKALTATDQQWTHEASTWWRSLGMLAVIGVVAALATGAKLTRVGKER